MEMQFAVFNNPNTYAGRNFHTAAEAHQYVNNLPNPDIAVIIDNSNLPDLSHYDIPELTDMLHELDGF